jgi:DNA-binding NtrC family response regulator
MSLQKILVADDEESMRWVLSKALKKKVLTWLPTAIRRSG